MALDKTIALTSLFLLATGCHHRAPPKTTPQGYQYAGLTLSGGRICQPISEDENGESAACLHVQRGGGTVVLTIK